MPNICLRMGEFGFLGGSSKGSSSDFSAHFDGSHSGGHALRENQLTGVQQEQARKITVITLMDLKSAPTVPYAVRPIK